MKFLLPQFQKLLPLAGKTDEISAPAVAGQCVIAYAVMNGAPYVLAAAKTRKLLPPGMTGELFSSPDGFIVRADCSHGTADALRAVLPWCGAQTLRQCSSLILYDSPEKLISGGQPGVIAVPEGDGAEEFADTLAFAALKNHFDHGFALLERVSPDQENIFCGASLFVVEYGSGGNAGEADPYYCNTSWIVDENNAVTFDSVMLEMCRKKYSGIFSVMKKNSGHISRKRGEDFQFLIRPEAPPEQVTAVILYLARELFRHGNCNVSFVLPEPENPLWRKIIEQYGQSGIIRMRNCT